ncbi:MAG: hypothetical protein LBS92_01075 [Candidatus Methanoplasma sp.]|jgi:hypothetical protein|nr:hypothetical protein [Candidatus Methanoplasma sp.]
MDRLRRIGSDSGGLATIVIAAVVVIVVVAAGAAAYVALSGNDGGGDKDGDGNGGGEPLGYGMGSEFTYSNGTRTVTGVVVGVGIATYVVEFDADEQAYYEIDLESGKLLFQGVKEEPSESTGSGDDSVNTWKVTGGTEISVKKIDGLYTVCAVKIAGTSYSIDTTKNAVKPVEKLPDILGDRLEYHMSMTVDIDVDGSVFSGSVEGTFVITYLSLSSDGRYMFTVKSDVTVYVDGIGETESNFAYVVSDSVTYETVLANADTGEMFPSDLPGEVTVQKNVTLSGTVDGDVKVDKYAYALTTDDLGGDGDMVVTSYVGKDYLYKTEISMTMGGDGAGIEAGGYIELVKHDKV